MKRPLNQGQIEIIPQLRKEGLTPLQIAKRYNCAVSTIHAWERKFRGAGYDIPYAPMGRPAIRINPPQK